MEGRRAVVGFSSKLHGGNTLVAAISWGPLSHVSGSDCLTHCSLVQGLVQAICFLCFLHLVAQQAHEDVCKAPLALKGGLVYLVLLLDE